MYTITGKERGVMDFTTVITNPSVDDMKGLVKRGKVKTETKSVKVVDSETGTVLDEVDMDFQVQGWDGHYYSDNAHYTKLFKGVENDMKVLSSASLQVLFYMISNLKMRSDSVSVDAKELAKTLEYSSSRSIYDGLFGLLKAEFIYKKTGRDGEYFINVNKIFRGNRLKLLGEEKK